MAKGAKHKRTLRESKALQGLAFIQKLCPIERQMGTVSPEEGDPARLTVRATGLRAWVGRVDGLPLPVVDAGRIGSVEAQRAASVMVIATRSP